MRNCYKIKNLFGPYIYDRATSDERSAVEEHIRICEKCANDLKDRMAIFTKINFSLNEDEIIDPMPDKFIDSVYKKVALDALKNRSREVFIRKYILQPSLAMAILAIGILAGITRFNTPFTPVGSVPLAQNTVETARSPIIGKNSEVNKLLDGKKIVRSITKAQVNVAKPKLPLEATHFAQPKDNALLSRTQISDSRSRLADARDSILVSQTQMSDSWTRLADANVTNYSLGDYKRAMSEYQKIIDDYPDTEAAYEAKNRINIIFSSLYGGKTNNDDNTGI